MANVFIFKKIIPILTALLLAVNYTVASNTESITVSFSEEDFTISANTSGALIITSSLNNVGYPEIENPGLPILSTEIAIPIGKIYKAYDFQYTKRLIRSNTTIANSPTPVQTDMLDSADDTSEQLSSYSEEEYPISNCQYVCTTKWNGSTIVHYLLCPFVYNTKEKNLYFIDSITINITLEEDSSVETTTTRSRCNLLKDIVVNSDNISGFTTNATRASTNEQIDYVIITCDSLKSTFQALATWKKTKGLYSKIISIEDIKDTYEGNSLQSKIKKCLYDLYCNNGLIYALLGGDDTIVPVRGCYGKVNNNRIDQTIPTDLFYGCFGGDFEWDSNDNGIYAELDDNIDLSPSIFVTRIPIRTSLQAKNFINKLLNYEKNPIINNNILMCGTELWGNQTDSDNRIESDAEIKGGILYSTYIEPYWNGHRDRFYDTFTDYDGGADYNFTAKNLKEKMSLGYSFMDVITHGNQTSWSMEGTGAYYSSYGKSQTNSSMTIITTMACSTNAFDSSTGGTSDPCLSESLIRNGESGVIAYLGCSRYGWGYYGARLGVSLQYESQFYKNLFSQSFEEKNFGLIVAISKYAMVSFSNSYNASRWVQFGLNPIGDPEMPIFTTTPLSFDDLIVKNESDGISISTKVSGCRICAMSSKDNGNSYYKVFDNVDSIFLSEIPEECSICITKQNYIPRIYNVTCIQNQALSGTNEYEADFIRIGNSVTTVKDKGNVIFSDGSTEIKANNVILAPGTQIKKGAKFTITNN
jgi:hypothetical protein